MAVITVSRMVGSGGSDVAARVAAELGWALLDDGLVETVAERLGVPAAEVRAREERVPSLAQRLADAIALATPELAAPAAGAPLPPSEERVLAVTERVITDAAARGHVVLVGRGAQAMLAARTDALHVFCYAPRQALVARMMRQLGIPARDAEAMVDDGNRQREQYVRTHWKRSWRAPENYHLCLDTDWLGVEGAADIVVRLARARFGSGT